MPFTYYVCCFGWKGIINVRTANKLTFQFDTFAISVETIIVIWWIRIWSKNVLNIWRSFPSVMSVLKRKSTKTNGREAWKARKREREKILVSIKVPKSFRKNRMKYLILSKECNIQRNISNDFMKTFKNIICREIINSQKILFHHWVSL